MKQRERNTMVKAPVSNPALAKTIVIGASVITVLVARFLPAELQLWRDLLTALGIFGGGVGAVQVVQAPKHGGP
jgi:hypothetical protein